MGERVGRRGFLKMIAGAVAGAVVATQVVEHVAADAPQSVSLPAPAIGETLHPYQEKFWGQENVRFAPAVRGRYSSMYFPKGDQGQILTTNPGTVERDYSGNIFPQYDSNFVVSGGPNDYRLEPATDEPKLAYGWRNTLLAAKSLNMTPNEVRERFTAEEVDLYVAISRLDTQAITIK